VYNQSYLVYYS